MTDAHATQAKKKPERVSSYMKALLIVTLRGVMDVKAQYQALFGRLYAIGQMQASGAHPDSWSQEQRDLFNRFEGDAHETWCCWKRCEGRRVVQHGLPLLQTAEWTRWIGHIAWHQSLADAIFQVNAYIVEAGLVGTRPAGTQSVIQPLGADIENIRRSYKEWAGKLRRDYKKWLDEKVAEVKAKPPPQLGCTSPASQDQAVSDEAVRKYVEAEVAAGTYGATNLMMKRACDATADELVGNDQQAPLPPTPAGVVHLSGTVAAAATASQAPAAQPASKGVAAAAGNIRDLGGGEARAVREPPPRQTSRRWSLEASCSGDGHRSDRSEGSTPATSPRAATLGVLTKGFEDAVAGLSTGQEKAMAALGDALAVAKEREAHGALRLHEAQVKARREDEEQAQKRMAVEAAEEREAKKQLRVLEQEDKKELLAIEHKLKLQEKRHESMLRDIGSLRAEYGSKIHALENMALEQEDVNVQRIEQRIAFIESRRDKEIETVKVMYKSLDT